MPDKSVQILKILRGEPAPHQALMIARVLTSEPAPVTLLFEGSDIPLDLDIFEVPVKFLPLQEGDRFLALPIAGNTQTPRWGLLQVLNRLGGIY